MKIAFFETEKWEEEYLKNKLSKHKLRYCLAFSIYTDIYEIEHIASSKRKSYKLLYI